MTQVPDAPDETSTSTPMPATISAGEMEAALSRALSPRVPEQIKRALITAMQTVLDEVDDE